MTREPERPKWRIGVVLIMLASLVAVLPSAPYAVADEAGGAGDFVPVSPMHRAVDTRSGIGGQTGPLGPNSTTAFTVRGIGGVPGTGVRAVLLTVTPISPTSAAVLTLFPTGASRPPTSTVNIPAGGAAISNNAIVAVGADGKVNVHNNAGNTHVVLDIHGWFTDTTGGAGRGGFAPVPHTVLFDTRNGTGVPQAPIPARGSLAVPVPAALVPADANSLLLNVVVVGASASSWLGAQGTGVASTNVMSFATGTTASGLTVKIGSDNRIHFYNNATAAINVTATVQGYFTTNPSTGAGLRVATARLLNGPTIAANSTVDIAVGGVAGVSTQAVAGAALNLTVASAATSGSLRAWPLGAAEPATSVGNFATNVTRANLSVVRPGAEGKVRVRNVSSGTIRLFVDLQGWFAGPVPSVPVEQFSATVAMQTRPVSGQAVGTLEYSYVDNIGRLFHGHQQSLDNFSSIQWTPVSGNEAFSGRPALVQGADGRLQVHAQHASADVWSATQTAVTTPTVWTAWTNHGGAFAGRPATATLPDGTPVAFAVGADGVLWHRSGSSVDWRSLGDHDLVGTPAAVTVRDGIQLVGVSAAGELTTALYGPSGTTGSWVALGGSGLTGTPTVVMYPGFRLRIVVRAADGSVQTKVQNVAGDYPADWTTVPGLVIQGAPAALLSPSGTAEIVVRGTDNEVYNTGETGQGSGAWRNWARIAKDGLGTPFSDPSATDPTVVSFTSGSGPTWAVVFRNLNNANRFYSVAPSTSRTTTVRFSPITLPGPR